MAATKTLKERTLEFELRLKELYQGKYVLISDYINADTYIILKHKEGYIWKTKPRFLDGIRQCPEVAFKTKSKRETFRLDKNTWQTKLDNKFGLGEYIIQNETISNAKTKVMILHTKCQRIFEATMDNMINTSKKGCTLCYGKKAKTKEQVQEEISKIDSSYEVLEVCTKDGHRHMKCKHTELKCNNHEFVMRVSDFVSKHAQRCPLCKQLELDSKAVRNLEIYLNENSIEFQREIKIGAVYKAEMPYDFYLPKYNLLIEYDGIQHFKASGYMTQDKVDLQKVKDEIKTKVALEKGYNFLRIKYTQDEIKTLSNYLKKLDKTMNCSV